MTANVIIGTTHGGTGQITASNAFNALSPMTEVGDMVYRNNTGSVRLPKGTERQNLSIDPQTLLPVWSDPAVQGAYGINPTLSLTPFTLTAGETGYIEYTPSSFFQGLLTTYPAPPTAYLIAFPNIGLTINAQGNNNASVKAALWTNIGNPDFDNVDLARTVTVLKDSQFQLSIITASRLSDLRTSGGTNFRLYIKNINATSVKLMGYGDVIGTFYLPNGFN